MKPTEYDDPYSCNKCGSQNETSGHPFDPESSGEIETRCKSCGHKDYWHFGFFASAEDGLNASKKYSFGGVK